jgi:hypothetical protein
MRDGIADKQALETLVRRASKTNKMITTGLLPEHSRPILMSLRWCRAHVMRQGGMAADCTLFVHSRAQQSYVL